MTKTFEDLKDEEYLVSLGRRIAHVCWDGNGELHETKRFDLEHTCRALNSFSLFDKRYAFVGDRVNASIIGIDEEDRLDIKFPSSNNPINFVGVISPQKVTNPAISDLEQILLINHLSYGLIGINAYEVIRNGEISRSTDSNAKNKRVLGLESDDDVKKRILALNSNYCYKILGKELVFAGIEDKKLSIGRIRFNYLSNDDIKKMPQIPEIPYHTIIPEYEILLEHKLVLDGKVTVDNAEIVKCIEAYYDENGVLRVFAGTDETRIYAWNFEREEEVCVVYKGEKGIISNLQVFEGKLGGKADRENVLAFNTRIHAGTNDTYLPIQLVRLSFNSSEQRSETAVDIKELYTNLMPNWFGTENNILYFTCSHSFNIANIADISEEREAQKTHYNLRYSNTNSKSKEVRFDKSVGGIVQVIS
ncbi:hypothetical protein HY636_03945 [Candidatus Woesearchaeota archaeon]|nr:hypothetical protein [Candidatus Woesearchaeota archaeon]